MRQFVETKLIVRNVTRNVLQRTTVAEVSWNSIPASIISAFVQVIASIDSKGNVAEACNPKDKPWFIIELKTTYGDNPLIVYDGDQYERLYRSTTWYRETDKYKYKIAAYGKLPNLTSIDKQLLDEAVRQFVTR